MGKPNRPFFFVLLFLAKGGRVAQNLRDRNDEKN